MSLHGPLRRLLASSPSLNAGGAEAVQMMSVNDPWAALVRLGHMAGVGSRALHLLDVGALQAVVELAVLQLGQSLRAGRFRSGNGTEGQARKRWVHSLADDLRSVVEALPQGHHSVTIGYHALSLVMQSALAGAGTEVVAGPARSEGFSTLTQAWWLGRQAAGAAVRRLCEVGFNAGHSALSMLLSAPSAATLVSFDLGSKPYSTDCAEVVSRVIPGDRFTLILGPSSETVPRYTQEHPDAPPCNVVFIDGGHSEAEASNDLSSMRLLATSGWSLVVMDDVGCWYDHCIGPTRAWERFQRNGRLRELGCEEEVAQRWCWGVYL